jgi:hypothetical protein
MLPTRALSLISEYSKPMTKPNWRKSMPLTTPYQLYNNTLVRTGLLMYKLLMNIIETDWYNLHIRERFNITEHIDFNTQI